MLKTKEIKREYLVVMYRQGPYKILAKNARCAAKKAIDLLPSYDKDVWIKDVIVVKTNEVVAKDLWADVSP